jgi:hypothetical protein
VRRSRAPDDLSDDAIRQATVAVDEVLRLLDAAAGCDRGGREVALEQALETLRAASVPVRMALISTRGTP